MQTYTRREDNQDLEKQKRKDILSYKSQNNTRYAADRKERLMDRDYEGAGSMARTTVNRQRA